MWSDKALLVHTYAAELIFIMFVLPPRESRHLPGQGRELLSDVHMIKHARRAPACGIVWVTGQYVRRMSVQTQEHGCLPADHVVNVHTCSWVYVIQKDSVDVRPQAQRNLDAILWYQDVSLRDP
jgi:hypothetical protein